MTNAILIYGKPSSDVQARARTRDFGTMIDGGGGIGPRYWRGKQACRCTEQWIAAMVEQVRRKELNAGEETALHAIAHHRELNGALLDRRVAAVELINVLRPAVAIAQFVSFGALALQSIRSAVTRSSKNSATSSCSCRRRVASILSSRSSSRAYARSSAGKAIAFHKTAV